VDSEAMTSRREQAVVVELFRVSTIGRAFDRLTKRIEQAALASRTFQAAHAACDRYWPADRNARLRFVGTILVTATAAHIVIAGPLRATLGWRAWIVPAVFFAQGVLLLAVSKDSGNEG
jgi:hypothetical protein